MSGKKLPHPVVLNVPHLSSRANQSLRERRTGTNTCVTLHTSRKQDRTTYLLAWNGDSQPADDDGDNHDNNDKDRAARPPWKHAASRPFTPHATHPTPHLPASFEAPAGSSFHGLLLSCRDIHAETAALLYSANRFIIYYRHPGSLGPLHAMTEPSLASLARLEIVLYRASCHHPTEFDSDESCYFYGRGESPYGGAYRCKRHHRGLHRLPLLSHGKLEKGQRIQGEWHTAATYLSAHVTSRLELSLVCDIDP
ncbi:hypothetical protein C8A03DRAFT_38528 [Achaetomium macrosporum]|uniref:Uncharacterized protein n=1 Tax=Achaetomium macrosporum TaxID=79813 RepID=A0AAN7C1Y7_9PEZI|nr:hypothetical protein C8A03DRAFT_38528 [Achaetomium macrosporum]